MARMTKEEIGRIIDKYISHKTVVDSFWMPDHFWMGDGSTRIWKDGYFYHVYSQGHGWSDQDSTTMTKEKLVEYLWKKRKYLRLRIKVIENIKRMQD
jgi:hypothetical protein